MVCGFVVPGLVICCVDCWCVLVMMVVWWFIWLVALSWHLLFVFDRFGCLRIALFVVSCCLLFCGSFRFGAFGWVALYCVCFGFYCCVSDGGFWFF